MYNIPTITTHEDRGELLNRCEEESEPAIWINQIRGRTWCFVIVSLEPTTRGDGENLDILTEGAVEQVNQICEEHKDTVRTSGNRLSIGAMSTRYGATYMMFPDMKPTDAEAFAEALTDIVLDEANRENKKENFFE